MDMTGNTDNSFEMHITIKQNTSSNMTHLVAVVWSG